MELAEKVARHDEQIKTLFEQQATIRGLTESTHVLALSVQKLTDKIASQDERLDAIEDSARYKSRAIWSSIVSGVLGAAVAAVCAIVFK